LAGGILVTGVFPLEVDVVCCGGGGTRVTGSGASNEPGSVDTGVVGVRLERLCSMDWMLVSRREETCSSSSSVKETRW
jgi:hypothetical protein